MTTLAWSNWQRILVVGVVVGASLAVSFGATRIVRRSVASASTAADSTFRANGGAPASGTYLVAYVMMSSRCAACRDERTKSVLRSLGDSLRSSHASTFARISVVAIVIDGDVSAGVRYVESLGPVFDEISIGGGWLNQHLTSVVWRDALAKAAIPQVVLIQRQINARRYPRDISVGSDSVLISVTGRDSLTLWVNGGTQLSPRHLSTAR